MQQYYVYEHWRKDLNECFYVGIGKVPNSKKIYGFNTKYSRAFEKSKRSKFWKNIALKVDYEIRIVFESIILKDVENKEIELIKFYGRRFKNEGSLVNFDNGGKHSGGYKINRDIPILQIDTKTNQILKIWKQPRDIEEKLGFLKTNIVKCCKGKQITAYGYIWRYKDKDYSDIFISSARYKNSNRCVGIKVTDMNNNIIGIYRNQREAAEKLNLHRSTIHKYLHGISKNKFLNFEYQKWK